MSNSNNHEHGSGYTERTPQNQYLTAEQVARDLGVCKDTVYRLARSGRLPHLRLGRLVRFDRGDVKQHLQQVAFS